MLPGISAYGERLPMLTLQSWGWFQYCINKVQPVILYMYIFWDVYIRREREIFFCTFLYRVIYIVFIGRSKFTTIRSLSRWSFQTWSNIVVLLWCNICFFFHYVFFWCLLFCFALFLFVLDKHYIGISIKQTDIYFKDVNRGIKLTWILDNLLR